MNGINYNFWRKFWDIRSIKYKKRSLRYSLKYRTWHVSLFSVSDKCDITLLPSPHHASAEMDTLTPARLLKEIYATCADKGFLAETAATSKGDDDDGAKTTANLLRIGVGSLLGGLLWGGESSVSSSRSISQQICTFLLALRSILRYLL